MQYIFVDKNVTFTVILAVNVGKLDTRCRNKGDPNLERYIVPNEYYSPGIQWQALFVVNIEVNIACLSKRVFYLLSKTLGNISY